MNSIKCHQNCSTYLNLEKNYRFLSVSAGTSAPKNTHKIGTQCGCEYGYKNYESFGSLLIRAFLGGIFSIKMPDKSKKSSYIPTKIIKASSKPPCTCLERDTFNEVNDWALKKSIHSSENCIVRTLSI